VGAAAYRAAEKLKALESAAYRSGESLGGGDMEITHDYTRKKGRVHKEIQIYPAHYYTDNLNYQIQPA